jgi:hypothetical protein
MKKSISILAITMLFLLGFKSEQESKYVLIRTVVKQIPNFKKKVKVAEVNQKDVDKLDETLRALAAYYSSLAGSNCDRNTCDLTKALFLGMQGSSEHKKLINKWFPNDSIAKIVVRQNCFLASSGSSYFRNYSYLEFVVKADTIIINYDVTVYDHGKTSTIKGPDKVLLRNNEIIVITQNMWK